MSNLLKEFISALIKDSFENELLNEYVVPMGFSLQKWKEYKKKHKISNADYHKENPEKKWKVVHGNKKGEIGKSLPGLSGITYNKANSAHSAIVMSKK